MRLGLNNVKRSEHIQWQRYTYSQYRWYRWRLEMWFLLCNISEVVLAAQCMQPINRHALWFFLWCITTSSVSLPTSWLSVCSISYHKSSETVQCAVTDQAVLIKPRTEQQRQIMSKWWVVSIPFKLICFDWILRVPLLCDSEVSLLRTQGKKTQHRRKVMSLFPSVSGTGLNVSDNESIPGSHDGGSATNSQIVELRRIPIADTHL